MVSTQSGSFPLKNSSLSQVIQREALTRLLIEKGIFIQEELLEMVKLVSQEMRTKERWRVIRQLPFFKLTILISILLGIGLPVVLGVKDPVYIAVSFTVVWFIYSIILFGYVFLIEGRRNRNK